MRHRWSSAKPVPTRSLALAVAWLAWIAVPMEADSMRDAAEAPKWTTSTRLLAEHGAAWRRLDEATRSELLAAHDGHYLDDFFEIDVDFWVHDGDLTVDASLHNGHGLVVLGDLTIAGSYDDDEHFSEPGTSYGFLVVTGDLRVENLASQASLHVGGSLIASGLVYTHYNDWTFEVEGDLEARGWVNDDKAAYVHGERRVGFEPDSMVQGGIFDQNAEMAKAMRWLRGDLFDPDGLTNGEPSEILLDDRRLRELLSAGEPLFRPTPADPLLVAQLATAFDETTGSDEILALAGNDPLIDRVIVNWREALSEATIERLIERADIGTLRLMARRTKLSKRQRRQLDAALAERADG